MKAGDELAGRYRLGALPGQGGMGEVWEGIDNNLQRRAGGGRPGPRVRNLT